MSMGATHPGFVGNRFDRLHGDVALLAGLDQCIEVRGIVRILHREVVVRQQHRVKVETLQAAPMCGSYLRAMARDTDGADQPLCPGLDAGFDRSTWA